VTTTSETLVGRLLDVLLPWRVVARDLEATRQDSARTNRRLETLIRAIELHVTRLPEVHRD